MKRITKFSINFFHLDDLIDNRNVISEIAIEKIDSMYQSVSKITGINIQYEINEILKRRLNDSN